jgi:hypothetical protein
MQMVALPSSGGFAPVAPMLFTSQLTLSSLVTGCFLAMFPCDSSGVTGGRSVPLPQLRLGEPLARQSVAEAGTGSNCLFGQALFLKRGSQGVSFFTIAFSMVRSLRIQAVIATLCSLPAPTRRE